MRAARADFLKRAVPLAVVSAVVWIPLGAAAHPQIAAEALTVTTDHPRLFLRPQRLRLLRRERERASVRWRQFDALVSGGAPLPEKGFALALHYQVTGNAQSGRQAVAWAMSAAAGDLRQLALVFDWCQEAMDAPTRRALAGRIERALGGRTGAEDAAAMRARAFAAIALYDHVEATPARELERVRRWWAGTVAPALAAGRAVIGREDAYPLYELLHAVRDNTLVDLRETSPEFFRELPYDHLLSYYPAPFQAPENEFYLGAARDPSTPDLRLAALSRAAELTMVAYDPNAPATQVLQGWLMHDQFMLRGPFGAPYEFLWANPYQPGLSHEHVPPVFHNAMLGRLFVRSGWEDSAAWFGFFDGVAQRFENGRAAAVDTRAAHTLAVGDALICVAGGGRRFSLKTAAGAPVFVVGLEPRRVYLVEVDDEGMYEGAADPGGILEVEFAGSGEIGVRLKEAPPQARPTAPAAPIKRDQ
jgi:hypothetical protein